MILGGYFDESIRVEADDPLCVAGYVFKPTSYRKFCDRWRKTVLKFGQRTFTHFHMTDLFAGHNEYKGLGIPDRVQILSRAVDAIAPHFYLGVGAYFDCKEFEYVAGNDWPQLFGSIYSAACQMAVQGTGFKLTTLQSHLDVLYVLEDGHTYQHEADAALASIKRDERLRKLCHYRNHLFEDKKKECGLQAADLLAWWVTKVKVPSRKKPALAAFLPPLARLASTRSDMQQIHDMTGKRLEGFLKHQIEAPKRIIDVGPRKRTFR